MKIVFATNNEHKLKEVRDLIAFFNVVGLKDIGCNEDIPETSHTLEGNAKLKVDFVKEKFGFNCFSDDTGLEVEVLDGAPGVYSARYAGESANAEDNISKLLEALKDKPNRKAQFRTAIAVNFNSKHFIFEGVCKGEILTERRGAKGFGYDTIFKPEGSQLSFAEMSMEEKGNISHRGKAIEKLVNFLHTIRY